MYKFPESQIESNIVHTKWVFKIKKDGNGKITKYKARLVARGFSQQKGMDYTEIYSPVVKLTIFRSLLAQAVEMISYLYQIDVKTAFRQGVINEEIYIKQPTYELSRDVENCS